jgi:hypothetical protein
MNGRENGGARVLEKLRDNDTREVSKKRGQRAIRRRDTNFCLPFIRLDAYESMERAQSDDARGDARGDGQTVCPPVPP